MHQYNEDRKVECWVQRGVYYKSYKGSVECVINNGNQTLKEDSYHNTRNSSINVEVSIWCLMTHKNRRSSNRIRRMDKVVVRDWCGWLNQESFLKAYNIRFIDRVNSGGHFYGSKNHGYSSGE